MSSSSSEIESESYYVSVHTNETSNPKGKRIKIVNKKKLRKTQRRSVSLPEVPKSIERTKFVNSMINSTPEGIISGIGNIRIRGGPEHIFFMDKFVNRTSDRGTKYHSYEIEVDDQPRSPDITVRLMFFPEYISERHAAATASYPREWNIANKDETTATSFSFPFNTSYFFNILTNQRTEDDFLHVYDNETIEKVLRGYFLLYKYKPNLFLKTREHNKKFTHRTGYMGDIFDSMYRFAERSRRHQLKNSGIQEKITEIKFHPHSEISKAMIRKIGARYNLHTYSRRIGDKSERTNTKGFDVEYEKFLKKTATDMLDIDINYFSTFCGKFSTRIVYHIARHEFDIPAEFLIEPKNGKVKSQQELCNVIMRFLHILKGNRIGLDETRLEDGVKEELPDWLP